MHLDCSEHCMCLADYSHDHRTLLHGFRGILDLEDAALRREGDGVVVVVVSEHDGCVGWGFRLMAVVFVDRLPSKPGY